MAAGYKRVIDCEAEKSKLFATSEEEHTLWQVVMEDGRLEDCEEWFSRFRIAVAGLKRIEDLEEGRRVLMPTVFEQCKIALNCMHPEFKEKFNVAVRTRAAKGKRVKMENGVPDVGSFDEMKELMREAQVFWDDDSNKCGRVGVGINAEEDTSSDEIEEEGNGNDIGEEGFDGGAEVDTSGDNNAFGEEDSDKGIEQVKGPDDGAEGDEMSELDKARLYALAEEEYEAEVERVRALGLIEEDGEMQP